MSPFSIGIDIGGTSSRAALVDQNNVIVDSGRCPTPDQLGSLVNWIADNYRAWTAEKNVAVPLGLALPGVVDPATGTLVRSVNLPWLEREHIVDLLEPEVGIRAALMTDAEAATWGEYGDAGGPAAPFAHLRLGTGVACGVVVDGNLVPTDTARRTHWPLLIVDGSDGAPLCSCGLRGCLEIFAGGDALFRKARDLGFRDLSDLSPGFDSNYKSVAELVDRAAIATSVAVANLARKLGVERIVLGGGVLTAFPQLFPRITAAVEKSPALSVQIKLSRLGDEAGTIGAARLASRRKCVD